jgi:hypothetical protein
MNQKFRTRPFVEKAGGHRLPVHDCPIVLLAGGTDAYAAVPA